MIPRGGSAIGVAITIALGLVSRRFPVGLAVWDKSLGDGLYAVAIYLVAAFVAPGRSPRALGAFAFATSFAIELFQLTGVPSRLPRFLRLVLGTTFAWHDVACYAVGALAIASLDAFTRSRK